MKIVFTVAFVTFWICWSLSIACILTSVLIERYSDKVAKILGRIGIIGFIVFSFSAIVLLIIMVIGAVPKVLEKVGVN